jgi:hypothetical protein
MNRCPPAVTTTPAPPPMPERPRRVECDENPGRSRRRGNHPCRIGSDAGQSEQTTIGDVETTEGPIAVVPLPHVRLPCNSMAGRRRLWANEIDEQTWWRCTGANDHPDGRSQCSCPERTAPGVSRMPSCCRPWASLPTSSSPWATSYDDPTLVTNAPSSSC